MAHQPRSTTAHLAKTRRTGPDKVDAPWQPTGYESKLSRAPLRVISSGIKLLSAFSTRRTTSWRLSGTRGYTARSWKNTSPSITSLRHGGSPTTQMIQWGKTRGGATNFWG